jgi:AraC-like DNA-binding protein
MAFSAENIGDDLFNSVSGVFPSLPALLDALMRALVQRVEPLGGAIHLSGIGTLSIGRKREEIVSDWLPDSLGLLDQHLAAPPAWPERASRDVLRLPIRYAEAELGELRLELPAAEEDARELVGQFARHCGLLVKRYEVRRWTEQRLGRPLLLVGMSKPLRELERFLELSVHRDLPVLLRGEFGTEKAQLAAMIHCCSPQAAGPLVQIDCADPEGTPGSWVKRAEGGTLYLSGIDELDPKLQKQLPQYLPSRLDRWQTMAGTPPVRLIASTTADLPALVREGGFSRALLAEIDFLSATIPPLRERTADIDALICQALERNGFRPEDKRTDALVASCKAHDWPDNLFELERVIARLAVMTEGRPIQHRDICRHAPAIAAADPDGDAALEEEVAAPDAAAWVRVAIDGAGPALARLHAALVRALVHLGRNYAEPLSLGQLAWQAGVSPSHLSFLFRSGIGMSFKTLLAHIRIHKACELLAADARRNITDVSFSVGFADLSHFEKSFRRIVHQSPREFRRSIAATG